MTKGILFVGNFLSHARGHRHYCEEFADRIEARGWNVVRTSSASGRIARLTDMVRTTWERRNDYGVAHVDLYSGAAFFWAEVVCFELRRLRKPFVLTMHGGNLPQFAQRWPRRMRRLLTSADIVTSPSKYLSDAMAYGRDTVIVPNAIDLSRYPFALREAPNRRLTWLRAFHAAYNPLLGVEVLARLCARNESTTLRMIGPDRHDGTLQLVEQRARELGVADRLEVVGPIANDDVPTELSRSDVLLNTTNIDNTPISVLEAMGCGLCVVSTDVGGLPYLLEHEHNALLVPPRDPAAMTDAVERIFAEPGLAARISQSARERALTCDWAAVGARWENVFESVYAPR